MIFFLGAVTVLVATGMLASARHAITHYESSSPLRRFAESELAAVAITAVLAFAVGCMASGLAADHSAAGLAEFCVAVGAVVFAIVASARALRRRASAIPVTTRRAGVR